MKKIIFIYLFIVVQILYASELKIFNITLVYDAPDSNIWNSPVKKFDESRNVGSIMYVRNPIIDSEGRSISPVIAIIYEKLPSDSISVIEYSFMVRMRHAFSFEIDSLCSAEAMGMKYLNGMYYDGYHIRGNVRHEILLVHIVKNDVGIQIICDSTENVYNEVVDDMIRFIRSVDFK